MKQKLFLHVTKSAAIKAGQLLQEHNPRFGNLEFDGIKPTHGGNGSYCFLRVNVPFEIDSSVAIELFFLGMELS